jgi:hypothetical protein
MIPECKLLKSRSHDRVFTRGMMQILRIVGTQAAALPSGDESGFFETWATLSREKKSTDFSGVP